MPIDPRMVKWDEEPKAATTIDPKMVKWDDKYSLKGEAYDRAMNYSGKDAVGGAIRGAGSIGATIIRPLESAQANQQRRRDMDEGLTALIGSDPNSIGYNTTKLGAEVAGTSGVGGLFAKALRMIPGAAAALPTLIPAIESGGMTANGAKGLYGLANRVAGGAVTGGATAGLVDPQEAKTGMMIGGATPAVLQAAGTFGKVAGDVFGSKPINPTLQQTARESVNAGYVIPPNMVAPSMKSRVIESISGKQATQQLASTRNNEVTERLTRQALGIADDVPLTKATLDDLRKTAGVAYSEVSALSPQAAADLEALKVARNEAQSWFKAYNVSKHPDHLATAKAKLAQSDALEQALEAHAAQAGRDELIPALIDARKQIAKTYTVERALNDASGTVDARVFGRLYEKGKPLSDGLDVAGKFASAFPTISKSTQQMGSPASHNLTAVLSALSGGAGASGAAAMGAGVLATGGLGVAGAAVPFIAPAAARSIMFSGPVQRAMVRPSIGPGLLSETIDDALPLLYKATPLLSTSR